MLLANPPSVHELLLELTPTRMLRRKTIRYISNRVYDLLDIAINSENVELAGRALSVLAGPNTTILATAAESMFFHKHFAAILSPDTDHNDRRVSAFATVTELCLASYPGDLQGSFGFFSRFLLFTDNLSVLFMFKNLLLFDEKLKPLYSQLKALKFVDRLALQVSEYRTAGVQDERLSSLYRVAGYCAGNYRLRKCCLAPSVIAVFMDMSHNDTVDILNAQWDLLAQLCCEETADDLLELFGTAASLVTDNLESYVCSALEFCAQMIKLREDAVNTIDVQGLIQNVKTVCRKYSSCSVLLKSAARFILSGFRESATMRDFATGFLDLIVDSIRNKADRNLYAFMIDCGQRIAALAEDNEELSDLCFSRESFAEIYRTEVCPYQTLIASKYGSA